MRGSISTAILGAGVTGLAAARASALPVYEAAAIPGGLCASYYVRPGRAERLPAPPEDRHAYRFEPGGGHWIFGATPLVRRFLEALTPLRAYERRAAVYFPESRILAPYPLQYHLSCLGPEVAAQACREILSARPGQPGTLAEWLEQSFGPTLMALFFAPFHEAYTAGLWTSVAPQDAYKSPVDPELVQKGAAGATSAVGYNRAFLYPRAGCDALIAALTPSGGLFCGRRAARLDAQRKLLEFADGSGLRYQRLLSTLPLNRLLALAGLETDLEPDPSTAVLVLNLGARRGPRCPDAHWLYVPRSRAGFYRVGFYSNVEAGFAPLPAGERVAVYVERAFRDGARPAPGQIQAYTRAAVAELQAWGFIGEVEVADPTWVEVAYTWRRPGSRWPEQALARLEEHDIISTGRFGKWAFQGIAESVQDGLLAGAALREGS